MKKYNLYKMRPTADISVKGVPQQITGWSGPKSEIEKIKHDSFLDDAPNLCAANGFWFDPDAKITDFMTCPPVAGYLGFIASVKLLNLLQSFKVDSFKHYPVKINNHPGDFTFIHLISSVDVERKISFSDSVFEVIDGDNSAVKGRVKLSSFNDWYGHSDSIKKKYQVKGHPWLKIKKMVFEANAALPDLFQMRSAGGFLISENLKTALLNENITGIDIEPSEVDFEMLEN